jgi:hypothetical protein
MEANNKPVRRKNMIGNIRRRMNSGSYNVSRNAKKNQRDIREKIAEYEKKEREGKLKHFMIPRYDEAKELMARIEAMQAGPPAAVVAENNMRSQTPAAETQLMPEEPLAHIPGKDGWMYGIGNGVGLTAQPSAPEIQRRTLTSKKSVQIAEPSQAPPLVLKKRLLKSEEPLVSSEFVLPKPNAPPQQAPIGYYNSNGEFHVTGHAKVGSPIIANIGSANNVMQRYSLKRSARPPKEYKPRWPKISEENAPYLEEASKKFLPLPQLYNPFTGEAYKPEDDPQPNIVRAHDMLEDIMKKAIRRAKTIRKRKMRGV